MAEAPAIFKPVIPILRLANDNDARDPVVAYWCRFYAVQAALKIDSKSTEAKSFIISMMDKLETDKKARKENEAISDEIVAQAHVENFGMRLFDKADGDDRAGTANINTAKLYLSSAHVFDVLSVFGDQSPEVLQRQKYAKWRAMIIMKAVKNREPIPLPENESEFNQAPVDQPPTAGFVAPGPSTPSGPSEQWPPNDGYNYNPAPTTYHEQPGTPDSASDTRPPQSSYPAHALPTFPAATAATNEPPPTAPDGTALSPGSLMKAQKYCKFAGSALQYNDVNTAVDNLQKALLLLTTGQDS